MCGITESGKYISLPAGEAAVLFCYQSAGERLQRRIKKKKKKKSYKPRYVAEHYRVFHGAQNQTERCQVKCNANSLPDHGTCTSPPGLQ